MLVVAATSPKFHQNLLSFRTKRKKCRCSHGTDIGTTGPGQSENIIASAVHSLRRHKKSKSTQSNLKYLRNFPIIFSSSQTWFQWNINSLREVSQIQQNRNMLPVTYMPCIVLFWVDGDSSSLSCYYSCIIKLYIKKIGLSYLQTLQTDYFFCGTTKLTIMKTTTSWH